MRRFGWPPVRFLSRALAIGIVFFLAIQLIEPALHRSLETRTGPWPEQPRYRSDRPQLPADRRDRPRPLQFAPCPQSLEPTDQVRLGPPPAASWSGRPVLKSAGCWFPLPETRQIQPIRHHRPPDRAPPTQTV